MRTIFESYRMEAKNEFSNCVRIISTEHLTLDSEWFIKPISHPREGYTTEMNQNLL